MPEWVLAELRAFQEGRRYGSITINFESGRPTFVEKKETVKGPTPVVR